MRIAFKLRLTAAELATYVDDLLHRLMSVPRLGDIEDAIQLLLDQVVVCQPPLDDQQLMRLWAGVRLQIPRLVMWAFEERERAFICLKKISYFIDDSIEVPWSHFPRFMCDVSDYEQPRAFSEPAHDLRDRLNRLWATAVARITTDTGR